MMLRKFLLKEKEKAAGLMRNSKMDRTNAAYWLGYHDALVVIASAVREEPKGE